MRWRLRRAAQRRKAAKVGSGMMARRSIARAGAGGASLRAGSGRLSPVWRVLERSDLRFEQQDGEQMRQQVWLGGALIGSGRRLQSDQAFEALEGEFDAPAQSVEVEDVLGGEVMRLERSDEDHPVGGRERGPGDLMAAAARLLTGLAPGRCECRGRLLDGDETQRKGGAVLAGDPDRPIDLAARGCLAQRRAEVE